MNRFTCIGHMASDVEIRSGDSWKLAKFLVAVTHTYGKKNETTGEWEGKETAFIPCVCWNNGLKLADLAASHLSKGKQVGLEGKFKTESWEKDGTRHSRLVLTVEQITLLGNGSSAPKKDDLKAMMREIMEEERKGKQEAAPSVADTAPSPEEEGDGPPF